MTDRILIIDDDKELTQLLSEYLHLEGFETVIKNDGVSGLAKAYDESVSLILLDVMMPGLNGFEILKALGGQHVTPIIMLTAKGDPEDVVKGLDLGADDYLAKPFKHDELISRIKATLRRVKITQQDKVVTNQLKVNGVEIDHATRAVRCNDTLIEMTGTEFQILDLLMSNVGNVVSKSDISEQVLQRRLSPFDRSIDMHLSNIRKKLAQHATEDKLKTIRGAGYIFLSGNE